MKKLFLDRRVAHSAMCGYPEQEFIAGCMSLSDQIRVYRAGGLPPAVRQLNDSVYDEDDVSDVDPSSEYGKDRFERVEAITDMISDRMLAQKKKKLQEAQV